jgi:hypothetical protein
MGPTTQEISVCALSNAYPGLYRELQVRNFTHVDMVVTFRDGTQEVLPTDNPNYRESEASVELSRLKFNGLRSKETRFGKEALPIPGSMTRIPYELIRTAPYRVREYDLIISTVDHSYAAAQMLSESNFNPVVYETSVDEEITDPRLCFQVLDPARRWGELYVSVFGQTIILRAGHWADPCPLVGSESSDLSDHGKLCCYLRYPHQYSSVSQPTTTVFEVSLENVLKEEPIVVPGGDVICIAPTMDALAKVIAKKRAGYITNAPQVTSLPNMISKDIYDDAERRFKAEIDRINAAHKQEIENLKLDQETKNIQMRAEIQKKDQEISELKAQIGNWKSSSNSMNDMHAMQEKLLQERYKTLKLAEDAKAASDKAFWDNMKMIGATVTAVASAVVAIVALQNKKGK